MCVLAHLSFLLKPLWLSDVYDPQLMTGCRQGVFLESDKMELYLSFYREVWLIKTHFGLCMFLACSCKQTINDDTVYPVWTLRNSKQRCWIMVRLIISTLVLQPLLCVKEISAKLERLSVSVCFKIEKKQFIIGVV